MKRESYVIGVDYGSDSCRGLLINALDGREISSSVFEYPRWKEKKYCNPGENRFRQHPLDYIEGLKYVVTECLKGITEETRKSIKGISIDTTGSTPTAIDKHGTPLALLDEFKDDPDAMFILWKDHTSIKEANEITQLCKNWGGEDFTKFSGGVYSSEWFWSKILHTVRKNEKVKKAAYSWLEHCDWMPALLTGEKNIEKIKRSRCAAGHKAMWNESHGGLPSQKFLNLLDPYLGQLRERLYDETYTSETSAGNLCEEWAEELGLSTDIIVSVGAFDAHMGAIGGQIQPYSFVKVMGTSTCDILIIPEEEMADILVPGICGQVDGSVISGMIGLEAGQSGFGDIYAWFKEIVAWPLKFVENSHNLKSQILFELEKEAAKIVPLSNHLVSIDWMNGRRTPFANQKLKGAIVGINLGDSAPAIYRALIEGTAFGAKSIIEKFREKNIRIDEIIAIGGVAKKSPLIMQILADILNMPIKVAESSQTVALGAAIFAAVASGIYSDIGEAQRIIGSKFEKEFYPIPKNVELYKDLYTKYNIIGDFIEEYHS
ncbi:MAG: ribulokinase [Fusobacteriaceae bacterium]